MAQLREKYGIPESPQLRGIVELTARSLCRAGDLEVTKVVASRRLMKVSMPMGACDPADLGLTTSMGIGLAPMAHLNPVELGRWVTESRRHRSAASWAADAEAFE